MKFTSTRSNIEATSLEAILQGLAPDGGLFVPSSSFGSSDPSNWSTLADAERCALGTIFDDVPAAVREDAIKNLLAKFPANDPIPLVDADGLKILELFHGPTGAFKDVALSVLPVLMVAAATILGISTHIFSLSLCALGSVADVPEPRLISLIRNSFAASNAL